MVKMSKDPNANRGIFYVRLRRVGVIRPQYVSLSSSGTES